jgi:hypothetical protein
MKKRAECLDRAKACVCKDRQDEYGSPEDNFKKIAEYWGTYKGTEFTPLDVSIMMALLKVARIQTGTATEDSFVDACGYIACGMELANKGGENSSHEK